MQTSSNLHMKLNKIIIPSIVVTLMMLISNISCSKRLASPPVENYSILKEWVKERGGIFQKGSISFNMDGHTYTQELAWDRTNYVTRDGKEYFYIPFLSNDQKSELTIPVASNTTLHLPSTAILILRKDQTGMIEGKFRVRTYDTCKSKDKIYDVYYDMGGRYNFAWCQRPTFNPERIYKTEINNTQVQTTATDDPKRKTLSCASFMFTTYEISCGGTMENTICTYSPKQVLFSYCVKSEEGSSSSDPNGWDPGNSSTSDLNAMVLNVVNDLKNPCLNSVKDKVTSASLKSFLANLYSSTFLKYDDITLSFKEDLTIKYENGLPGPSRSIVVPSQNTWTIYLNPSFAQTSSQEFIATAIIHELIHSYIFLYKEYRPQSGLFTDLSTHTAMLNNWIGNFSALLTESMGLSSSDATNLALYGIADALMKTNSVDQAKLDNFLQEKYNTNSTDINAVGRKYEDGLKGAKCP